MRKALSFAFCTFFLTIALASSVLAKDFSVLTNQLPPIKFEKDGEVQGIAGDILIEIMTMAGIPLDRSDFKIVPWKEAYDTTLNTPNTICLAMAQSVQRKPLFKWVGPIYITRIGLIAPKCEGIKVDDLSTLKSRSIATIIDSFPEKFLIRKGLDPASFTRFGKTENAIRALVDEKVDMLAFAQSPTFYTMLQEGVDPNDFELVYEMRTVDLYIAFNKATDDALIAKLQTALEKLKTNKKNGMSAYDRIIFKYFRPAI